MSNFADAIEISFDRHTVNGALRSSGNNLNSQYIGLPRGSFSEHGQDPDNHDFIQQIEMGSFAGHRIHGLRPFVHTLHAIDHEIAERFPELHKNMGHLGGLCCRLVKGSVSCISSHSWGIAIDVTFDGQADCYDRNVIQRGLYQIAPIFHKYKLYWGIAFRKQGAMHFEASAQLIEEWAAQGKINGPINQVSRALQFGDRGPEVETVQKALNVLLQPSYLKVDGVFGRDTRAAVMAAHVRLGMPASGRASRNFIRKLKS